MNPANQSLKHAPSRPRLVEPPDPKPPRRIPWKRAALYAMIAVGFFLLGLVPMWLKGRQYIGEREAAQQELRLVRMDSVLAAAAIFADRGDYEPARQLASDFFTSLRSQIDRGGSSDLSPAQVEQVKFLLNNRDDIITLLARGDPAAANRLSDMYVAYRKVMNDVKKA